MHGLSTSHSHVFIMFQSFCSVKHSEMNASPLPSCVDKLSHGKMVAKSGKKCYFVSLKALKFKFSSWR